MIVFFNYMYNKTLDFIIYIKDIYYPYTLKKGIPLIADKHSSFIDSYNREKKQFINNIFVNIYLYSIPEIFYMTCIIYINLSTMFIMYKRIINCIYVIYLYKNIYHYIDLLLNLKIFLCNLYKNKKDNLFELNKIILYTDLIENHDVTKYFKNMNLNEINKKTFDEIYTRYNLKFNYNDNIRLKIFYSYKDNNYISYFVYQTHNIPYPPYTEDILKDYRNDIIMPIYNKYSKNIRLYSLFNIDSKTILYIKINDIENKKLLEYFELLKTPFNDFGILYNNPVKLSWLLTENNIDLDTFNDFNLKFLNLYFDEEKMDLFEHYIKLNKNDLDKFILSDRMKDILCLISQKE